MTERECAIVEAFTGICMLAGEKQVIAQKYIAEIMHGPVLHHEMASKKVQELIRDAARPDFLELCRTATPEGVVLPTKTPEIISILEKFLLPCPFCGEEAELLHHRVPIPDGEEVDLWSAGCVTCDALQRAHQPDWAVLLWNQRWTFDGDDEPWNVINVHNNGEIEPVTVRMCPFCGKGPSVEQVEEFYTYSEQWRQAWRIGCVECGIFDKGPCLESVKARWNMREPLPPPRDVRAFRVDLMPEWETLVRA